MVSPPLPCTLLPADVSLIDPAGLPQRSYPFGTPAETMVADVSPLTAG